LVLLTECYYSYEVKEDHMGGARGRCGAKRRSAFWVLVKERDYMEDLGIDGRIISRGGNVLTS
jgi:hypothetical protein